MGSMLNRLKDTLRTIEGLNDIISPEDKEDIQKRLIHGLKALTIIPVGNMSAEEIEDLKTVSIINSLLCERRFNIQIRQSGSGTLWAETIMKIYNKHYDFEVVKIMPCDQCQELYPATIDSEGICKECESRIECERIEKGGLL
jgi:hypothetical protein